MAGFSALSTGGQPLHFADLGELVAFLEQEDDPGKSVDEQGQDCP